LVVPRTDAFREEEEVHTKTNPSIFWWEKKTWYGFRGIMVELTGIADIFPEVKSLLSSNDVFVDVFSIGMVFGIGNPREHGS
jgi:hypothetical protein